MLLLKSTNTFHYQAKISFIVIKTLKGKWAKKIWARTPSKQMLAIYEQAWESLSLLDAITNWKDFAKIPGINLHPLHGDREGQ